jgi:hypothetical protein
MRSIDLFPFKSGNPVFDSQKLDDLLCKNPSRATATIEIVQQLIVTETLPIDDIRAACKRGQLHQASHMLNTLQGSISNLGGHRVCEVAAELAIFLEKDANTLVTSEMLNCLAREYALFISAAKSWLDKLDRRSLNSIFEEKVLELQLQEFKSRLLENNLKAFDLYDGLQQNLKQHMKPEFFAELSDALQTLDFHHALECIEKSNYCPSHY